MTALSLREASQADEWRLLRIVELDTPNEFFTPDTLRHLHNRVKFLTGQVSDRPRHLRHPDATSAPRTRSAPTSLTGEDHPCSSQASFRSRLCHWPQAGILPHQIQPQVVQRTHITPSPHLYLLQTQRHPRLHQTQPQATLHPFQLVTRPVALPDPVTACP